MILTTIIEKSLIACEDYIRTFFEEIPVPIYVWKKVNSDFVLADYNNAANPKKKGMIEIKEGVNASRVFDYNPEIIDNLNSCLIKQQNTSIETRYRIKETNELKFLKLTFLFVPPDLVLVFVEDFTEKKSTQQNLIDLNTRNLNDRKEIEEKLKESKEAYRLITENINDMIAIINKSYKLEFVTENPLNRILGYSKDEIVNKIIFKFIHPDDIKAAIEAYKKGTNIGENSQDLRFRHKNGNYVWLEVRGQRFIDREGEYKGIIVSQDISERKNVEQKLKESEEKYRLISENSNDLIRVLDHKFKIRYLNEQTHLKLLGYSNQDLIGKTANDILYPEEANQINTFIRELIKKKEVQREGRIKHKDGHWIWFSIQTKLFQDSLGNWKALLVSRDISERKNVEQKLKESEERYRLISENANDIISITNSRFRFDYVNEIPAFKIAGYHSAEVLGKIGLDFIHPDDHQKVLEAFKKGLDTGKAFVEARLRTKNGNYLWVEINATIFLDKDKITTFLLISRDISDRKAMEKKLSESEERYRLITENANDMIATINRQFKYDFINEKVHEKILGYSRYDLINKRFVKFIHPDDLKRVIDIIRDRFKLKEGKTELRFKKKDGTYVWLEVTGVIYNDDRGELKGVTISRDISDRKIALEKVQKSEETLRKFIEETQDGVVLTDEQGNIVEWNRAQEKISGLEKLEVINKPIWDILYLATPDKFKSEKYHEQLKSEIIKLLENQASSWINKLQELELQSTESKIKIIQQLPFLIKVSKRVLIGCINRDITEKKNAEQKLKESEEKFRLTFEGAPDAIFWSDASTGIINNCNKAAEFLLGKERDEIVGQHHTTLHPTDKKEYYSSLFKKYTELKGILLRGFSGFVISKSRKLIPVKITASQIHFEDKLIIQGIFHDISDTKMAEELLKESEYRYRELYNESPAAYFTISPDKSIRRFNKAALELLGYTKEEMMNLKLFDLYSDSPDGISKAKKCFEKFLNGETFLNEELLMKHKNGSPIWINLSVKPVIDEFNNVIESRSVAINISERKKIELALEESEKNYREAYDQANFYKDLFTHDMNNILQIMNGYAELIINNLDDSENSKKVKDFASIIKKQVQRGSKLTSNVYKLSEIQDSKSSIRPTEINHLLINSIDSVNKSNEDKKLDLKIVGLDEKFIIRANDLLQDIFDNLLINAINYNENPSVEILIKISREMKDRKKFIKMEFIDNGMGIVDERKKVIFERGKREFKGYKGMGIGLSLVQKIIAIYNGRIWVEDKVKGDYTKGSNFIILLPE